MSARKQEQPCFIVVAAVASGLTDGRTGGAHFAHLVVQCSENLRDRIFQGDGDGLLASDCGCSCTLSLDADCSRPQEAGLWLLQGKIADDSDLVDEYILPAWQTTAEAAYAWRRLYEHEAVLVSQGQPLDGVLALAQAIQTRQASAEVAS